MFLVEAVEVAVGLRPHTRHPPGLGQQADLTEVRSVTQRGRHLQVESFVRTSKEEEDLKNFPHTSPLARTMSTIPSWTKYILLPIVPSCNNRIFSLLSLKVKALEQDLP